MTRHQTEARLIGQLIRMAREEGYTSVDVYDGGKWHKGLSKCQAMQAVFSVDESTIRFQNDSSETYWVCIMLGNGLESIVDYSMSDDESNPWNLMMERHFLWCERLAS